MRERIYEVFRAHGIKTIFGNPGSTELSLLQDFPNDFRYILGLQEASVVAMASGYSLFTGKAAVVNLHTHAGTGNAMGAIVTAFHAQAPVIITAGQQDRRHVRTEPLLWGTQFEFVKPYVKWSVEPPRTEDVPEILERAYHVAMTEPKGPVFVSIYMDGLEEDGPPVRIRTVTERQGPDPEAISQFADVLSNSQKIAIVAGPQIDGSGANASVVQLAEKLDASVFLSPIASRWSFPTDHYLMEGRLAPAMRPIGERLAPFDTVLVIGADVFLYYPLVPGEVVREGTKVIQITNDPAGASRSLIGLSMISDIRLAVDSLLRAVKECQERPRPESRRSTRPAEKPGEGGLPKPDYVYQELAKAFPQNVVIFQEAPSSSMFFFRHAHLNQPNSYFETASGGLGFAMPASIGAALGEDIQRPIVCILGEGSAQYSIQSLWSAAEYGAAVTFVILNNGEYAILKSFANLMGQSGIPGLDFSHINFKGLAEGYGVEYREIREPGKISQTVSEAITSRRANLVNIPIDPFVPALLGRSQ